MDQKQADQYAKLFGVNNDAYVSSIFRIELPCTQEQAKGFQTRMVMLFGNATMITGNSMIGLASKKGEIYDTKETSVFILESAVNLQTFRKHVQTIKDWATAIKIVCNVDFVLVRLDEVTYPI